MFFIPVGEIISGFGFIHVPFLKKKESPTAVGIPAGGCCNNNKLQKRKMHRVKLTMLSMYPPYLFFLKGGSAAPSR